MDSSQLDPHGRDALLQMVPTLLDLARQILAASDAATDPDARKLRTQIEESVIDAHRLILRRWVDGRRPGA